MERITLLGEKSIGLPRFRRLNLRLVGWTVALWTGALAGAAALVADGYRIHLWWALVGLATIAAIAERQSIPITGNTEVSVGFLPFVFTAIVFGPLAAMLVGGLAGLADFRRPYMRWLVYLPIRALSMAAASLAAGAISGDRTRFGAILLMSLVASIVWHSADLAFNMLTLAVRGTTSPWDLVSSAGPLLVLSLSLYVPLVALLVYGYHLYSIWIVATFLVPALALQRLTQLYQEQRESTERLAAVNDRARNEREGV